MAELEQKNGALQTPHPKSKNLENTSLLLGHTKSDITKKVYRRMSVTAKPPK
ncbi:hypothetical protein [Pseudomonas sp. RIT-PI-S]|uniref:hypothetical protein n=1 Tax=Pseudomonas sp. RIT-PI-S TaxID=3035295 RepID=UPI0021D93646|nr:hypothetical protein [Pseudomonas sp. RIT-PI-S]